jgi:hypothetical protein
MPLAYTIMPGLRLLCIRATGMVTQPERIETMRAWFTDPAYANCDDALCDFLESESTPTMAEIRELVCLMAQRLPGRGPRKLAIMTSKPITFVVASEFKRIVEAAAFPMEVMVFAGFESAWNWLRPEESSPNSRVVTPPRR